MDAATVTGGRLRIDRRYAHQRSHHQGGGHTVPESTLVRAPTSAGPQSPPGPRPAAGPAGSPGFWLHRAALSWLSELDRRLRPLGLTHTQFTLLSALSWLALSAPAPTQQQVADLAGADRMMASRVLRGLAERGLLERSAHPMDARALHLRATAAGRALVRRAVVIAAEVDEIYFGPPGDADRERQRARLATMATAATAATDR
jgi:DNA-binding MarR family transcriptional regulator